MTNEPLKATHTPLPCPFCGGEARLRTVKLPMPYDCDDVCYYCTDCDVDGPHMLFDQSTHTIEDLPDLEAEALTAWNTRAVNSHHDLIEALRDVGASLAAAISLLERGGKAAKKAAPSDRMFDQMVKDYKASLNRTRAILTKEADR